MSTIVNCNACGESVDPAARFCSACGAPVAAPASPAETAPASPAETVTAVASGPPPMPVRAAVGPARQPAGATPQTGPAASDFVSLLTRFLRSPGVLTATLAAALGVGVTFAFGLLVAAIFSVDGSIIGATLGYVEDGGHASIVTRALRQTVATLLVPFHTNDYGSFRPVPALFLLVPLAATTLATAREGHRLRHLGPRERLVWGALTGVPFALLMMVPLLLAGYAAPSFGWTLVASLGWGGLAGVTGTWLAIRRDAPETLAGLVPARVVPLAATARTVLAPLAVLLAITTLIGTGVWVVQTLRGVDTLREAGRSTATATFEDALYASAHGIHFAELGALTSFRLGPVPTPLGLALPVTKVARLAGTSDASSFSARGAAGSYRLLDYHRPLPAWAFVLLAAPLLLIPALLALYTGFALARERGASTPLHALGWGALVGPAWALAMVVLSTLFASNPLAGTGLFGSPKGDSVLVTFLLGGALLGALGGLLSSMERIGGPASAGEATDA
jgi:hypothetical protein